MKSKEENKKISDKILAKMKTGEILSNRYFIPSTSKKEVIVRRLCEKIHEAFTQQGLSMENFSEQVGVSRSTLNLIVNFHCDKVSIDTCVEVIERLAESNPTINDVLIRMAVA